MTTKPWGWAPNPPLGRCLTSARILLAVNLPTFRKRLVNDLAQGKLDGYSAATHSFRGRRPCQLFSPAQYGDVVLALGIRPVHGKPGARPGSRSAVERPAQKRTRRGRPLPEPQERRPVAPRRGCPARQSL